MGAPGDFASVFININNMCCPLLRCWYNLRKYQMFMKICDGRVFLVSKSKFTDTFLCNQLNATQFIRYRC